MSNRRMNARKANQIRRGLHYGSNWAQSMLSAGGNDMLRDMLMQNLITWSWQHGKAANAAASRAVRRTRERFQAART